MSAADPLNLSAAPASAEPFLLPRVDWETDAGHLDCQVCFLPFTPIRRRHHCRVCGHVCCQACSPEKVALPQYGYTVPERVCVNCCTIAKWVGLSLSNAGQDQRTAAQAFGEEATRIYVEETQSLEANPKGGEDGERRPRGMDFSSVAASVGDGTIQDDVGSPALSDGEDEYGHSSTPRPAALSTSAVFMQCGGLEAVLRLSLLPDEEVQFHASVALLMMVRVEAMRSKLLAANLLTTLNTILLRSVRHAVHMNVIGALCLLAQSSADTRKLLGQSGSLRPLLLVAEQSQANAVRVLCLRTLAELAVEPPNQLAIATDDGGGLRMLMVTASHGAPQQKNGSSTAQQNLQQQQANSDGTLQRLSCRIIAMLTLCSDMTRSLIVHEECSLHGALSTTLNESTDVVTLSYACCAAANLCVNSVMAEQIHSVWTLAFAKLSRRYPGEVLLLRHAARGLANLALHGRNAQDLASVLPDLYTLLKAEDHTIVRHAVRALSGLLTHHADAKALTAQLRRDGALAVVQLLLSDVDLDAGLRNYALEFQALIQAEGRLQSHSRPSSMSFSTTETSVTPTRTTRAGTFSATAFLHPPDVFDEQQTPVETLKTSRNRLLSGQTETDEDSDNGTEISAAGVWRTASSLNSEKYEAAVVSVLDSVLTGKQRRKSATLNSQNQDIEYGVNDPVVWDDMVAERVGSIVDALRLLADTHATNADRLLEIGFSDMTHLTKMREKSERLLKLATVLVQ